jgi:hypothetical protein
VAQRDRPARRRRAVHARQRPADPAVLRELRRSGRDRRRGPAHRGGRINPAKIDERTIDAHLDEPGLPDVDLFIRTSGEQRASNFLVWQSTYAEFVFVDTPWPDFDRTHLWAACEAYAQRNRRFGKAGPVAAPSPSAPAATAEERA